jgi:hypothetical protein
MRLLLSVRFTLCLSVALVDNEPFLYASKELEWFTGTRDDSARKFVVCLLYPPYYPRGKWNVIIAVSTVIATVKAV